MPYSIPDRRELSEEERQLIQFLLGKEAPDRVAELDNLCVVARCGCGKCPTVLLGNSFNDEPIVDGGVAIADYTGPDQRGTQVGVVLWERKGRLAELEAWSPTGADLDAWPAAGDLTRLG